MCIVLRITGNAAEKLFAIPGGGRSMGGLLGYTEPMHLSAPRLCMNYFNWRILFVAAGKRWLILIGWDVDFACIRVLNYRAR